MTAGEPAPEYNGVTCRQNCIGNWRVTAGEPAPEYNGVICRQNCLGNWRMTADGHCVRRTAVKQYR